MADKIRVLLNEEEVDRRIKEIAEQINKDYEGKAVHLICILKGGVFFTCELAKRLTVPVSPGRQTAPSVKLSRRPAPFPSPGKQAPP